MAVPTLFRREINVDHAEVLMFAHEVPQPDVDPIG